MECNNRTMGVDYGLAEDTPHLPIKTYHWEDVRRARKKGGYPWTHITKPPFDEDLDVDMYTMDAFRRSRSTSTLGKSDKSDINDVTDDVETNSTLDSVHADKETTAKDTKEHQPLHVDSTMGTEKVEPIGVVSKNITTSTSENKENLLSVSRPTYGTRARSEEPSQKRKLSIESSYSRISLSKLAFKDKFRNVKEKLKIPKLLKRAKSDVQETRKPKVNKPETSRSPYQVNSQPVYIHIPLKPPPGETDEYSKFEFDIPGPSSHSGSLTQLPRPGSGKRKLSLLGLLTELKKVHDQQVLASESKQNLSSDDRESRRIRLTDSSSRTSLDKLKIEENTDDIVNEQNENVETPKEMSAQDIKELVLEGAGAAPDAYSVGSDISQYLDKDDKYEIITTEIPNLDIDCVIITEYDDPSTAVTTRTSNVKEFTPEWTRLKPEIDTQERVRAKSEEPKRKRKSSIDSSYSRKSLSKLAFMKKIKEAKNSLKLPRFLSFSKSDGKTPKTIPTNETVPESPKKKDIKTAEKKKPISPLYIHIPLKLPVGQQDEFSHLADTVAEIKQAVKDDEPVEEKPECETPISPDTPVNNIQLIILTPPSDDEILDSNAPETPSESDQKFFESLKVDELKCIAKKAVDTIYPNSKPLEPVVEDDKIEEDAHHGVVTEGGTTYWQMHPVLVDVEDGLKLSDAAIAMINEEMAKELDIEKQESKPSITPSLKKKVSFKRSRAQDGERIYEDVGVPNTGPSETSRSMSADEEKSYLDANVIKTTSLDDDYNKWSNITDHEYEPVNPPPEDMKSSDSITTKPNLAVNTMDQHSKHITFLENSPDDTTSENLDETPPTAQEFQTEIEDRFFTAQKLAPRKTETNIQKQETMEFETPPTKSETKKKDKPIKKRATGTNFNETIRTQADKLKTKLQGIKKPNIHLPHAPKFPSATFPKMHFKKPNFNVPKMPDMPSIKLASFSLTRKDNSKNSWRKRQYSTESNAGDSKTKKFDVRTYPRIFDKSKSAKKKSIDDDFEKSLPTPEFATVPRVGRSKAKTPELKHPIVIKDEQPKEYYYDKTRGVVTIPIDPDSDTALHTPSHIRYNQDINIDDGFDGEQDHSESHRIPLKTESVLTEWHENDTHAHTKSHVNGLARELHSDQSSGSLSEHRQGVIEEIDSDQFFLREKGISQDDIDVGKYLSSEIKEAFRNPVNALAQLQSEDREYDVNVTDQSQSSEEMPKRKWLKKPKRKKTPHVSKEQLSYDGGSDPENYTVKHTESVELAPTRPKRRSRKGKKKKSESEEVIPYQETIPFIEPSHEQLDYIDDLGLYPYEPEEYVESSDTYKNASDVKDEEFKIMGPVYINTWEEDFDITPVYMNTLQDLDATPDSRPTRPIRKNKSVKSLSAVDVDLNEDRSSTADTSMNGLDVSVPSQLTESQPIPPIRPNRKRSHTRSVSVSSLKEQQTASDMPPIRPLRFRSRTRSESFPSLQDNDIVMSRGPPVPPARMRSHTRSESTESLRDDISPDLDSILNDSAEFPCVEEPCMQVLCDRMGYAIVDKSKIREPPLPPCRIPKTPPRTRRKRTPVKDEKFATVPRPPERPLRNYSTLGTPKRTSRSNSNLFDDEKENVDINQYIEIEEDEIARRLQSGEVVQKMRERPLPAPPRPPRKARTPNRDILRDISHERNIFSNNEVAVEKDGEIETEPKMDVRLFELEQQILTDDHEETITHASLVVQPINNSIVLAHSEFFNPQREASRSPVTERIIPIEQVHTLNSPETPENLSINDEVVTDQVNEEEQFEMLLTEIGNQVQQSEEEVDSDEELSKIPDEFYTFKEPDIESQVQGNGQDVANLALQQLDTNILTVNELPDNKIEVSELEGVNMQVSEINSKAGNLVISGIELPPNVLQEMLLRLGSQREQDCKEPPCAANQTQTDIKLEQFENQEPLIVNEAEPPPVPPRSDSIGNLVDISLAEENVKSEQTGVVELPTGNPDEPPIIPEKKLNHGQKCMDISKEPPVRPPRRFSQAEKATKDLDFDEAEILQLCNVHGTEDGFDRNNSDTSSGRVVAQTIPLAIELSSIVAQRNLEYMQTFPDSPCREHAIENALPENTHCDLHNTPNSSTQPLQLPSTHDTPYAPSQPPLSFYNLRSSMQDNFNDNNIPLVQCRMCRHKYSSLSKSSSSEELSPKPQRPRRISEPSIPQLTGKLVQSCATECNRSFRNLVTHFTDSVMCNSEGKQDFQVILLMLLVLIAVLILVSSDGRVTEHHHHWEYFNPPKDL